MHTITGVNQLQQVVKKEDVPLAWRLDWRRHKCHQRIIILINLDYSENTLMHDRK